MSRHRLKPPPHRRWQATLATSAALGFGLAGCAIATQPEPSPQKPVAATGDLVVVDMTEAPCPTPQKPPAGHSKRWTLSHLDTCR